jgi:HEAT repeat protein
MEPLSLASIASIAGKLLMTEAAKAGMAGLKNHFQPDEITRVLKKAIELTEAVQSPTGGLFSRCDVGGPQGTQKFLDAFFSEGEVLRTLQKPLQDQGKPDVAILLTAFEKLASEHPEAKNYLPALLRPWMETFVESYFEQIKGICFQVAKSQYLQQLARRVDDVKFVGIAVPGEEVEKQEVLAQIFVMPDLREERSRSSSQSTLLDSIDWNSPDVMTVTLTSEQRAAAKELKRSVKQSTLLTEQNEWVTRDRSSPRIPAPKILDRAQKKAVVLGTPGSGKTILVSYFALMLCQEQQSDPTQIGLEKDADLLPVVVRIRDWILQPNMGLLNYLRWDAEENLSIKNLPQGFFEHWLDRGRALILLDGLDEVVNEAQQRKVAEDIQLFLNDKRSDNPVVITSRPVGYRRDLFKTEDFTHYTLEAFDDKQMTTFINHWYDSRIENKAQAERRKAELQKAFDKNDRIKLLATNPLLLTIITLIHRDGGELPRQRYELYETAIKTLLINWDRARDIKLYEQVLLFLNPYDLLYLLKKLAYWIHTQGTTGDTEGGTLIKNDELFRQLWKEIEAKKKCEPHEAKEEASRFIDFIRQRTGLLNEQGRDRYAFVHKTFQEYLTAEEIFDRADVEDDTEIILDHFRQHLHDQHWREVLLLLVSKLKGKKAQKAIQAVWAAESEYEQWLNRDLLFAGWCLTEDPPELTVVAADWVGAILDRLVGLEVSKSERVGVKVKNELEKIFHCFGGTSVERDVWEKLEKQEEKIYRFRMLEFQAVLGQEEEVIDLLLSLLQKDTDLNVRYSAGHALAKLGSASPELVQALLSLLQEDNVLIHSSVAYALGQLGDSSPAVVQALLSLLRNQNPFAHSIVVSALSQLGNTNPDVVQTLLSSLQDKDSYVRLRVAHALGELGNTNPDVVQELLSSLQDKDSYSFFKDEFGLGQLVNKSSEVVKALLFLLRDEDAGVRYLAAADLGKLENASPEVVQALLLLLQDQDSGVRYSAASSLGLLGNIRPEIIEALQSLLEDEDVGVRFSAAFSLVQLKNVRTETIQILLSFLQNKDPSFRYHAISALGHLENPNFDVLKGLLSLLNDEISYVRYGLASSLGSLGNTSLEVVNGLLSLLQDEEFAVRCHAASALIQLAKLSDTILPKVLQRLEQNPNNDGIGSAIDCLWSIVVK